MPETDLTTQVTNIQQTLDRLTTDLQAHGVNLATAERQVKELGSLSKKLDRLKELDDAKLEAEIQETNAKLEALKTTQKNARSRLVTFLRDLPQNLLTYWALVAFIVAALVAVYVYEKYGVGYFETYANIANTKQSAKYYVDAGQVLISRAEFAAAESAFKTATEIDPYNIEARHGLMLSQVIKPGEGLRADPPEVLNARLQYLAAEPAFKSNPVLIYFQGRIATLRNDRSAARDYFEESQRQIDSWNASHPNEPNNFLGNVVELGILDMWGGNFDKAIATFKTKVLADANQTTALNHLAECYIVTNQFDEANAVLSKLSQISSRVETRLVFGDLFRYRFASDPVKYQFELKKALITDRLAQDSFSAERSSSEESSKDHTLLFGIDYGRMLFIPFPLANTPQFKDHSVAAVQKSEQYRALTNYALSLDYALANDFTEANRYYGLALSTDTLNEFRCVFVYKTRFYRSKLPTLGSTLKGWFDTKAESLAKNRCVQFSPPSEMKAEK